MAMVTSLKMSNPKCTTNRINGVMVSMLASSAVDRGFEPRSGQTKDNKSDICCFSAKYIALRSKRMVGSESG
jgi:hypothetical protein